MLELSIPDMSCGHCVATVTKTVKALDADATVTADLASRSVSISTKAEPKAVAAALAEEGYPASPK